MEDVPRRDVVLSRSQFDIMDGQNNFAFKILDYSIKHTEPGKNVMCSPMSAQMALTLLANCAHDDYKTKLLNILNAETLEDLNETSSLLEQELPLLDPTKGKVAFADGAWLNSHFSESQLLKTALEGYGTSNVFISDFKTDDVKKEVNTWVKEHTNEMIPEIIDTKVDPMNNFVLANCLTFSGIWKNNIFKEINTAKKPFKSYEGVEIGLVDMMQTSTNIALAEIYNTYCWRIEYGNGAFSLYLICDPDNKKIIEDWAKRPGFNLVKEFNNNIIRNDRTTVRLPKLDFASTPPLPEALAELGITLMEFKAISNDGKGVASPTGIVQKVKITMTEKGTEAAAATVTVMDTASGPIKVDIANFDSPYVFFIAEQSTGAILFAGHIEDPRLTE